jgi:hypothetical protein
MILDAPSTDLTGLVLIAKNRTVWRWVGHAITAVGTPLSVWESPCRACGESFEAKIPAVPARLRRRFLRLRAQALVAIDALPDPAERRAARASLTITLPAPPDRRISAFELRNCPEHRWSRRDMRAEALV